MSKAPDDKPFDFNLDSVRVEKDLRPFRFRYDGQRFEMAHRETLDQIKMMEAVEAAGEAGGTLASLRLALGDDQWRELRKIGLRGTQLQKLSDAYDAFCGTTTGESPASTDS
ncbi:hypothetical protein [Actinomadura flavalba]|uniref:hypothetical protein n=1 Tax=Actinomadura flavalba TaxID=1120938 RepID=UPI0003A27BBD|nr:hypothetical protein [Actinomadura flavalba]